VDQAKAIPAKMNSILRLHFCVWTDADAAWISRKAWEACEDASMTLDDFLEKPCFIGLDLSATKDITGVAYVFPDGQTEDGRPKFALFARGYTPADTVDQRGLVDKAPYAVWVRDGWLIAPAGKVIRYDHVAYDIVDAAAKFDVQAVSYDRWLIKTFENALDEIGGVLPLMEHPQGTNQRKDTPLWMPQSVNQFEDLILEKRIRIEVNPALRSAVASACFWTSPAGLRRFEKQRATGRIDMALAATMAIGAAMVGEAAKPPSSPWDDPTFTLGG
jgi:phage terminase large subunit-like protein